MKAGKKKDKVGVQDIARVLKISASTVSRALNDHPRISKETKEKVKRVASRLGYNPGLPELMHPEKSEAIAVLVPSLENNLYREIIWGIEDYLDEQNHQTFVINTQSDEQKTEAFFKNHRKYGISGIIHLVSDRKIAAGFYKEITAEALPVVTVCEPDTETGLSSVLPDMYQGFYKIAGYLKSLGIHRISMVMEDDNYPEDHQMVSTFKSTLEAHSMHDSELSVHYFRQGTNGFTSGIEQLLKQKNPPEAMLVKNSLSALEVVSFAARTNINIPGKLLLIAIGSDYNAERLLSNISLLKIPGYQMGKEAAALLFKQLVNPEAETRTSVLPVNFILKGTAIRIKR